MFKEILLITPKLASDGLAAMESALNSRFMRVAKKFGKGLAGMVAGGGLAGAALSLIDKLLNPLKEAQDAIDRTLTHADDLIVNAKQFGSTSGKLARLQAVAKASGLDEGNLNILLEKFQASLSEAVADPSKQTSVRKYAGEKDSVAAFVEFISNLQQMPKMQQIAVQQEIFGEKQILRMAEFLQTDLQKLDKEIGGPSADTLTKKYQKMGALEDQQKLLAARRGLVDDAAKAGLIDQKMITSQDLQAQLALAKENAAIKNYEQLASIDIAANEISNKVKEGILGLTALTIKVTNLAENVQKMASTIENSSIVKGIIRYVGGGK